MSKSEISEFNISSENYERFVGGKALAARILYDEMRPGTDPLSPENVMIVNTGPLTGTCAPASSRFNVTFKNVLTGGIASSNCGGMFGLKLRRGGYEGLIVRGAAENPVMIEVKDGEIRIRDAAKLWGLDTYQMQDRLSPGLGALVIGPAGENLVRYACAVSGERIAGRCGAGAVMGSKRLKAIVASGKMDIPIHAKERYGEFCREWFQCIASHPLTTSMLGKYGTGYFVDECCEAGILPTRNFSRGKFEGAGRISGRELTGKHMVRRSGCAGCPIRCERRVLIDGREVRGPEFETIGLMGSNIENDDLEKIIKWSFEANRLGIDTMSLGGTISFAMELRERGIKDFGLEFGETDGVDGVIGDIAYRRGAAAELGDGVKLLAERYGGAGFAVHAKGLEMASYDPRLSVGMGLGYATSNRGACHLNSGYMVALEVMGPIKVDPTTAKGKPELTAFLQDLMDAASSSGFCIFSTLSLIPEGLFKRSPSSSIIRTIGKALIDGHAFIRALRGAMPWALPLNIDRLLPHATAVRLATGLPMTIGRFLQMGERAFNMERLFNIREGFSRRDDSLPERMTSEPLQNGDASSAVKLEEMLPAYYRLRGWDKNGTPTRKKLRKLKIDGGQMPPK